MKKLTNTLRIIGQSILILVFGLAGGLLLEFKIPGHRTFTDNDAGVLAMVYGIFIIIGLGLILNSFIFKLKNHWKKFRVGVLVFVLGFAITVFIPRDFIIWTFLGNKESEFISVNENEFDYVWVKLELFKNNKFLCSSSNIELTVENIGKYELTEKSINLIFENEKSDFIGTKFEIIKDTVYCVNCKNAIKLIKN